MTPASPCAATPRNPFRRRLTNPRARDEVVGEARRFVDRFRSDS
jgi:hypothetical protein